MRLASLHASCITIALLQLQNSCYAYSFPPRRPVSNSKSNYGCGSGGKNNGGPPKSFNLFASGGSDGEEFSSELLGLLLVFPPIDPDDSVIETSDEESTGTSAVHITLRGGTALKQRTSKIFSSVKRKLPFVKDTASSESSTAKQQQEILASTNVTGVTAPKSELLPPEVITHSAAQAHLIGGSLTPETLDLTAKSINNWYTSQGYVMNSVTGATLVPSKDDAYQGRVELKVREAKISKSNHESVRIQFLDPCNDDSEETEGVLNIPVQSESPDDTQQYQKYRITTGRTRPSKLAKMVGIAPGSHFRIVPRRWSRIVASPGGIFGRTNGGGSSSAIFSTVHAVRPIPQDDGTVLVEVVATENKPFASVEYGVTKSLYSDQWEGEFDLKHANAFGGGEVVTFNMKKGRDSPNQSIPDKQNNIIGLERVMGGPTSWRMSVSDDSPGNTGYDLELFRDHVGMTKYEDRATSIGRTGATVRLKIPRTVLPRAVSASIEQIDAANQPMAPIRSASMTMDVGPLNVLRSGLSAILTIGLKRDATDTKTKSENSTAKPYFRGSLTSQRIVPLCQSPFAPKGKSNTYIDLALRNVISASTKHLPRHDAIMLGVLSRVRGYKYNLTSHSRSRNWGSLLQLRGDGTIRPVVAVANSISGNIEVRLPFRPFSGVANPNKKDVSLSSMFEGTLIAFGDWAFTHAHSDSSEGQTGGPFRQSCIGVGFRKIAQGLPLKVDAVITEHGTGGLFFGIGRDFGA